jgi:hypothetical protein
MPIRKSRTVVTGAGLALPHPVDPKRALTMGRSKQRPYLKFSLAKRQFTSFQKAST